VWTKGPFETVSIPFLYGQVIRVFFLFAKKESFLFKISSLKINYESLKLLYLVLPILKSFLNRVKRDLNKVQLTHASQRIMQRQQTSTAIDEQTAWEQGE
jgi:hypothetical protein